MQRISETNWETTATWIKHWSGFITFTAEYNEYAICASEVYAAG